ncbi:hypothetical protein D8824_02070 [Streptococcus intermedius]|nr:hypothetical protein D8833_02060 [Streptococcus intermedius]RSJ17690.1 hypothetical protein D8831_02070 [Streptococcus intermedius]RSJ32865.1 hypothetical protein D8824_02070 [Streptococcus intermedius]
MKSLIVLFRLAMASPRAIHRLLTFHLNRGDIIKCYLVTHGTSLLQVRKQVLSQYSICTSQFFSCSCHQGDVYLQQSRIGLHQLVEFIELNVSVHDGILDIVNILLDFTYRLLGGAKTLQLFINRSNSGLGGGDTGVVSIHLALKRILFKAKSLPIKY